METIRVIVAGGRDFDDYPLMCSRLDHYLKEKAQTHEIIIVSGGARGADSLAESYARSRGYRLEVHAVSQADWQRHGKAAGPIRNARMAAVGDFLVAFWDGRSTGTEDMIQKAVTKGIPYRVVRYIAKVDQQIKERYGL
jgi:hypothetical protein